MRILGGAGDLSRADVGVCGDTFPRADADAGADGDSSGNAGVGGDTDIGGNTYACVHAGADLTRGDGGCDAYHCL